MREPYEFYESYQTGMLPVGEGHQLYFEVSGNPDGKPVIDLHGGPGGGMSRNRRKLFDPSIYRVIQFDQRGCGRSTPHAADLSTDLATNTTHHLIADLERIREHFGVERWLVWGGSWGVTLGLAYAERFPRRVSEMILVSITLSRFDDFRWFAHGAGRFFPEAWERFRDAVPESRRDNLLAAYDYLLNGQSDPAVREKAAADWVAWEDALLSLDEGFVVPHPRWADLRYRMAFARLVTRYFSHAAWLEDDELIRNAGRLAGIPGFLIHGQLDISGPPEIAWALARAWPDAELHIVKAGHTGNQDVMRLLLEAAERFSAR